MPWMIGIAAVMLLAAGAGLGMLYAWLTKPPVEHPLSIVIYRDVQQQTTAVKASGTSQELYRSSYYQFPDPITTNLRNGTRIAQIQLVLGTTYDSSVLDGVTVHDLAIRAAVLDVIAAASESELRSDDGKRKLLIKIRDAANSVLQSKHWFPGIESAHFASIHLQ